MVATGYLTPEQAEVAKQEEIQIREKGIAERFDVIAPHFSLYAASQLEEIVSIVRDELKNLLGIDATPIFHRIYRWQRANPQYDVGHLEHVEEIDAGLPEGLYVTGSPYRGIGLPDCVHQGQQTAARILEDTIQEEPEAVLLTGN